MSQAQTQTVEGVTPAPQVQQPWSAPVANPPQPFSNAPAAGQPVAAPKADAPKADTPDVKALQDQLVAEKARADDLEKYRGWQGDFTRANQAGLGPFVKEVLSGKPIADVKREMQEAREAAEWLRSAGGRETLQPFVDILKETPAEPGAIAPAPQAAAPNADPGFVRKEELPSLFAQWQSTQQGETNALNAARAIAQEVGLVQAGQEPPATILKAIRRQNEAFLESIVGTDEQGRWLRDPTSEDLKQATTQTRNMWNQARAAAIVAPPKPPEPVPPLVNARGAGGQEPPKPIGQMTREEVRQQAQAVIERTLQNHPQRAQPQPPPDGMDWV